MSDLENAIQSSGSEAPAPEPSTDPAPAETTEAPAPEPAESGSESPAPESAGSSNPEPSAIENMLDSLTEGPAAEGQGGSSVPEAGKVGKPDAIPEAKADADATEPETAEAEQSAAAPVTDPDSQLLAGIKNPRSRARIQTLLDERKQAIDAARTYLTEVQGAGYDEESFGVVLQFGRLMSSDNFEDKRQALQMIDKVRENIAREIGEPVAGVDVLAGAPDLREKVNSLELTEEGALEIYRARKIQEERQARLQAEHSLQQNQQAQAQAIEGARLQIIQFGRSKSKEVDYEPKMKAIQQWLKDPVHMNSIISQPPSQWQAALSFLYDNIAIRDRPARAPQPITSTTLSRGKLAAAPGDPRGSLEVAMKNLGI